MSWSADPKKASKKRKKSSDTKAKKSSKSKKQASMRRTCIDARADKANAEDAGQEKEQEVSKATRVMCYCVKSSSENSLSCNFEIV
jgi:hypothetical protein